VPEASGFLRIMHPGGWADEVAIEAISYIRYWTDPAGKIARADIYLRTPETTLTGFGTAAHGLYRYMGREQVRFSTEQAPQVEEV
jgi:hypothetical protein